MYASQDVHEHKFNMHMCTYTHINNYEQMYTAYMHAHTERSTPAHTHVQVNTLMHTFSLYTFSAFQMRQTTGEILICKGRRKRSLKPQKESSFRRRLMVRMMELMEHCMPREKSDLPLYFDTYSWFLKQSMDSLTYRFLSPKTFWCKRFCISFLYAVFASYYV